jgi:hypothetical protein
VVTDAVWFQAMNQSLADLMIFDVAICRIDMVKSLTSSETLESCSVEYRPLKTTSRLTARPDRIDFHSASGNSSAVPELSRWDLASLTLCI